ncbi:ArsR/SmtB family transcription factor [Streptomyces atratus]|uniref:ArsR/SmtB family transcription factor n=1 Tax=Streptomyces atratus TaxID=1893 RepID=UPI003570DB41
MTARTLSCGSSPARTSPIPTSAPSRAAACPATELADAVGMEQSACSHQLRLLRNLGLVTGERRGRSVIYALYDNHVAELLDQALFHVEHLRLGLHDTPAEEAAGAGGAVAAAAR